MSEENNKEPLILECDAIDPVEIIDPIDEVEVITDIVFQNKKESNACYYPLNFLLYFITLYVFKQAFSSLYRNFYNIVRFIFL